MMASFQMELEHLISRAAPWSTILSSMVGTNVPLLCTFLKILSGNDPEYDSNDIDCYTLTRMCNHINGEVLSEELSGLTPPDQSPRSHVAYL